MDKKICAKCKERKRCHDTSFSYLIFLVGIVATVAIRIVTVLADISPVYGKIAWYTGIGGFFIYFVYKYRIEKARHKLMVERGLAKKLAHDEDLDPGDRELIRDILCALSSNKDRINYVVIFVTSAISMLVAAYFDLFRN